MFSHGMNRKLIGLPGSSEFGIHLSDLVMTCQNSRAALRGTAAVCLFSLLSLTSGCGKPAQEGDTKHYQTRGVVRGFAPDRKVVDVEHENIEGFMPSMTMPFSVRDPKQIADMRIGDAISFELTVTTRDSWIDKIKKIDLAQVRLPTRATAPEAQSTTDTSPRLREGDSMPSFHLVDQEGKQLDTDKFRGNPLVLTFIFTRCPIPNFCPLMTNNFNQLQQAIKNGSGRLAQTKLLSISFDPDFDTPTILKEYGAHQQADHKIWTFASGDKPQSNKITEAFSVYAKKESGTISHGLATALVAEDGKIERIWRGNGWTVPEVVSAIEEKK